MNCSCQTTGHDPGCPNHVGGIYLVKPDGKLEKVAGQIDGLPITPYEQGYRQALLPFARLGYGMADVRECPDCGKPDVHWSVSSFLRCRDCRNKDLTAKLGEHRDMIRWMAQTAHQAYHQDQPGTWEECPRDICASAKRHLT